MLENAAESHQSAARCVVPLLTLSGDVCDFNVCWQVYSVFPKIKSLRDWQAFEDLDATAFS